MKSEMKNTHWVDVTDQYTEAAKEQHEERQWESLANDFSIWSCGKKVPSDVVMVREFFMRFVNEKAIQKYNPPVKK